MENLLEMAKSDGKTRNFLHECYMADPDHIGTGFGRWLEENKEVLPVYLECMEQIDGRTGYLQEGFMLARMEAGTNLHLNPKDEEKLNAGDPDYVGAFEIVKEIVSEIVNKSIKGEEIDLGYSAKFHDFKTMIDRLNRTNLVIIETIADRISKKVNGSSLLTNIFGGKSKSNPSRSFVQALFNYIRQHANILQNIIDNGNDESSTEPDVYNFAKDAFLNVIGPYTGGNESVQELANILKDTLSNYQSREDETRAVVMQLVEAYKDESSREETIPEIVGRLNVRTDYPEAGDDTNKIFDWIDKNPSAEEINLLKKCDKEIKNNLRKSYVKKIEDAIDNSTVLNKDEKESAKKKLNSGTKQATTFAMFIKSLKDDPDALATRMLYGKGYKIKVNADTQNSALEKIDQEEQEKRNDATSAILIKMMNDFDNIQTKLKTESMDDFISELFKSYESYESENGEIDMTSVIENTEYTDPCNEDNFGNAIMTYIFGIGTPDKRGHNRLKNCIENSIKDCMEHDGCDLIDRFYAYMFTTINTALKGVVNDKNGAENRTDKNGIENAKRKISLLINSSDRFVYPEKFDLSWVTKDLYADEPFEKDAYIYMFQKAHLNA